MNDNPIDPKVEVFGVLLGIFMVACYVFNVTHGFGMLSHP